jgi:YHS domain-containing protein
MSDLTDLDKSIQEKLAAQQEKARQHYNHQAERMHEWERRHERYTALADHLVKDIIRPRLEKLASHFDNAKLSCDERTGRHTCVCSFEHTARFPATARLELAVSRDGSAENVCLLYDLSILPVYFHFDGQYRMLISVDQVNDEKVAAWFDDKIVRFLDAYLNLELVDQYQSENDEIDPVCGMRVNKLFAGEPVKYQGRDYYFCVPDCRAKFLVEPERFLGVTSRD